MKSLTILKYTGIIVNMIKKCALCSNEIGSNGIGLFCSKSCYSKNRYKINNIYKVKRAPIICKNCGKETIGKKTSKYCSRECHTAYARAKRSQRIVEEKECLCCKNKYLRAHKAQIYCSNECRMKSRKVVKFNKACIKCGKLFPVKQGQIYCSVECAPRGTRKDTVKLNCIICGNSFIGMEHHKYCSVVCRNKGRNKKKRNRDRILKGKWCESCGFNNPAALQSHHINRAEGNDTMTLCANCHCIFHHSVIGAGKKAESQSREEVLGQLQMNNSPIEEGLGSIIKRIPFTPFDKSIE